MKFNKYDILTIEDKNLLTDSIANNSENNIIDSMKDFKKNNKLVIYDETGKEIAQTFNKVMASGRVETLETLFRIYSISDKYPEIQYDKPNNITSPRWISVFGVGSGGAPLSEGNNPYIVDPNSIDLTSPLQFRTSSVDDNKIKYYDNLRKKDFTSVYLNWDKSSDDVYALLVCELNYDDLLGKIINEIGLYTCTHIFDSAGNIINKEKFTLYAKANMPSINKSPLLNTSAFKIAYKVFI